MLSLIILLDLSKAFNSASQKICLEKWCQLKTDKKWFEIYLSNLVQSVMLGSSVSSLRAISYGVP